jgi:hypothetical protein
MAHAWFDGGLLADRWANEGFASWYALDAAAKLKLKVAPAELTPEMIQAGSRSTPGTRSRPTTR